MEKIKYAIKNFALAIIVFVASFYLADSGRISAIIVGVCFIIGSFRSVGKTADGGAITIFIIGVALIVLGASVKSIDWLLKYIGAAALAFIGFYQITKIDKKFSSAKILKRVESIAILAITALIMIGAILSVFPSKAQLGKSLLICGSVIWILHTVYALVFMVKGEYGNAYLSSNSNFEIGKALNENDVLSEARKIANRWNGSSDPLPYDTSVKYSVSAQVVGDSIDFIIKGTLRGIQNLTSETYVSSVKTSLNGKLDKILQNIVSTAEEELGKFSLPHDYNINARVEDISVA